MRLLNRKNNEFDELVIDMNRRNLVSTKLNRASIETEIVSSTIELFVLSVIFFFNFRNCVLDNR